MIRRCDGTDPNLLKSGGEPCDCGLVFDDVDRLVIYPHQSIATHAQREALYQQYIPRLGDISDEE